MNALVFRPGEPPKAVKNLGWLRRNWTEVERFEIRQPGSHYECTLVVFLRDNVRYEIGWLSKTLCREWLDRPIFRGVPISSVFDGPMATQQVIGGPNVR